MCEHHQLIIQCQFNDTKTKGQGTKGRGFALMKHEIPHFSQWPQKHITQHHMKLFSPHHVCNEKGASPQYPKANYKCSVTPYGLKVGKDPT
jgi:hypothetical protein